MPDQLARVEAVDEFQDDAASRFLAGVQRRDEVRVRELSVRLRLAAKARGAGASCATRN